MNFFQTLLTDSWEFTKFNEIILFFRMTKTISFRPFDNKIRLERLKREIHVYRQIDEN